MMFPGTTLNVVTFYLGRAIDHVGCRGHDGNLDVAVIDRSSTLSQILVSGFQRKFVAIGRYNPR
jgi:hypothetical protein